MDGLPHGPRVEPFASGTQPQPVAQPRVRVLVADDHADLRRSMAAWIEGHPRLELVGLAVDGHEAVAKTAWLRPDLVIMDASMPFLDGFEATRQVKRLPGAPRVLYVSLLDDATSVAEAEAAGADAFLCKTELVLRIDGLLDAYFPPAA